MNLRYANSTISSQSRESQGDDYGFEINSENKNYEVNEVLMICPFNREHKFPEIKMAWHIANKCNDQVTLKNDIFSFRKSIYRREEGSFIVNIITIILTQVKTRFKNTKSNVLIKKINLIPI